MIDLHTHSYLSDGTFSPRELAQSAKEKGIETLALTDHDNLAGLSEFQKACDEYQIRAILGVEITIDSQEGLFHLLGLGIDPSNKRLQHVLDKAIDFRTQRMQAMLDHVQKEYGLNIDFTFLPHVAYGRFHMAILLRDQYDIPLRTAFDEYLIAFRNEGHINAEHAIDLIHEAGGKAVIAHPKTIGIDTKTRVSVIIESASYGLDGLEVYSGRHDKEDIAIFSLLANKYNLLLTAGSDFHGANKPDSQIGFWKEGHPITAELVSPYWTKSI